MSPTFIPSRAPSGLGMKCQSTRLASSYATTVFARWSPLKVSRYFFAASAIVSPAPANLKYDHAAVADSTINKARTKAAARFIGGAPTRRILGGKALVNI